MNGTLTLHDGITAIGEYAFKECSITRFNFPESMTEIGQGALMNSKVEEVSLPAQLKQIPTGTFQGCTRLKVVRLGKKTELISDYVFDGCPLTDLYVESPIHLYVMRMLSPPRAPTSLLPAYYKSIQAARFLPQPSSDSMVM